MNGLTLMRMSSMISLVLIQNHNVKYYLVESFIPFIHTYINMYSMWLYVYGIAHCSCITSYTNETKITK